MGGTGASHPAQIRSSLFLHALTFVRVTLLKEEHVDEERGAQHARLGGLVDALGEFNLERGGIRENFGAQATPQLDDLADLLALCALAGRVDVERDLAVAEALGAHIDAQAAAARWHLNGILLIPRRVLN